MMSKAREIKHSDVVFNLLLLEEVYGIDLLFGDIKFLSNLYEKEFNERVPLKLLTILVDTEILPF